MFDKSCKGGMESLYRNLCDTNLLLVGFCVCRRQVWSIAREAAGESGCLASEHSLHYVELREFRGRQLQQLGLKPYCDVMAVIR